MLLMSVALKKKRPANKQIPSKPAKQEKPQPEKNHFDISFLFSF